MKVALMRALSFRQERARRKALVAKKIRSLPELAELVDSLQTRLEEAEARVAQNDAALAAAEEERELAMTELLLRNDKLSEEFNAWKKEATDRLQVLAAVLRFLLVHNKDLKEKGRNSLVGNLDSNTMPYGGGW